MGVTDMLLLAAAAFSEEPAEGLTSQRGFPFHGLRYGFHIIFFLPQDLYLNPVPGSCERDEDNLPIDPPHPAAAINHFFDFEGERTIHFLSATEVTENTEGKKIKLKKCLSPLLFLSL